VIFGYSVIVRLTVVIAPMIELVKKMAIKGGYHPPLTSHAKFGLVCSTLTATTRNCWLGGIEQNSIACCLAEASSGAFHTATSWSLTRPQLQTKII
jgi:hypothetical protein